MLYTLLLRQFSRLVYTLCPSWLDLSDIVIYRAVLDAPLIADYKNAFGIKDGKFVLIVKSI